MSSRDCMCGNLVAHLLELEAGKPDVVLLFDDHRERLMHLICTATHTCFTLQAPKTCSPTLK